MRNEYMTTGEFAKLMGVTKETLFHYDKIGLFCPATVNEKGYRFYSIHQMEHFDTICLLKSLGMSLEEIRTFLQNKTADRYYELLLKKQTQLDQEIHKLQQMHTWIGHRIEKLKDLQSQDLDQIQVVERKPCYYYLKTLEDDSDYTYNHAANRILTMAEEKGQRENCELAFIRDLSHVRAGNYDYDNVCLLFSEKGIFEPAEELPGGSYLVAYHKGH